MMHPPHETAKLVGIKWDTSPEFAYDILEPHIDPDAYAAMRRRSREGKVVLRSVMTDGFDTKPVVLANRFNKEIERKWTIKQQGFSVKSDKVKAPVAEVNGAYSMVTDSYKFRFLFGGPHGAMQQSLLQEMSEVSAHEPAEMRAAFLYVRADAMGGDVDRERQLDSTLAGMRERLGDKSLRATYWLTNPRIHVVTYENSEADILARKLAAERGEKLAD